MDLKTLGQFNLLGDPSVHPALIASATNVPKGIDAEQSSRVERRARRVQMRVVQAGAQPIGWVSLACELQRDWARQETVADVVQIVLTERLLEE